jgi:hypothetical protein
VIDRNDQRKVLALCAERFLRGTVGYRQGQARQLASLLDMHLTREGYRLERIPNRHAPHGFVGDGPDCGQCGEGALYYLHESEVEL